MGPTIATIAGYALNTIGTIMMVRYGLPYRLPILGLILKALTEKDPARTTIAGCSASWVSCSCCWGPACRSFRQPSAAKRPYCRNRDERSVGLRQLQTYIQRMRPLVLATILALAATPSFAYCKVLPPTEDRAENLANETALTLCRAAELHDTTVLKSQQLDFQADLQAQARNFEQDLRMQQTFAAAAPPPQF